MKASRTSSAVWPRSSSKEEVPWAPVVANASMSLDGYIAKEDNTIGRLFDWLQAGDVEITTASPGVTLHLTPTSAAYWREWTSDLGTLVCGRTLFDVTDGWAVATRWTSRSSWSPTTCPWSRCGTTRTRPSSS